MRKAFSLIELMIVVVIIGVVYTLAITNFHTKKEGEEVLNLVNLQESMRSLAHSQSVRFLCLDDCARCEMFVDGKSYATYKDMLDSSVKSYRFDPLTGLQEAQNDLYFNENGVEERVCFSYTIDKSGVGEQLLVEFKKKIYDFTDYIGGTKIYDSLDAAVEAKNKLIQEVLQ